MTWRTEIYIIKEGLLFFCLYDEWIGICNH